MRRLLASIVLAASLSTAACTAPEPQTPNGSEGTQESALTVGTFTSDAAGFDTHSFYVDTGKEVVVLDGQFTPELAKKVIAEIQSKTSSPITYLVVTHPNPDKFNGAPAFQAIGAKVVASKATAAAIPAVHAYKKHYFVNVAKMFTEDTYPAEAKVDVTFSGEHALPLAAGKITLHELDNAGVTTTQTVAHVPAAKALFVGDLVHHQAHAWLEGGIVGGKASPDVDAWKKALMELGAFEGTTVYGGRGESANVDVAIAAQAKYLTDMEALVTEYVASLGASAKSELSGPNAGAHHKKLAELAAEKYPGYALPYMIEYGVYGLVGKVAGL